jgi:hypothetical protein
MLSSDRCRKRKRASSSLEAKTERVQCVRVAAVSRERCERRRVSSKPKWGLTSELLRVPDPCFEPSKSPPRCRRSRTPERTRGGVKMQMRNATRSKQMQRQENKKEKGQLERQGCAKAGDQEAQREERGSLSLLLKTARAESMNHQAPKRVLDGRK